MASLRLIYVVSKWNQETETFVRREVAAALEAGSQIQVVSLRPPGEPDGIVDETSITVVVPTLRSFLRRLGPTLLRRPYAFLVGLLRVVIYGRPGTWLPHVRAWAAATAVEHQLEPADVVLAHFAWLSATTADNIARQRRIPYAVFPHAHDIYEDRCRDRYLFDRLRRAAIVFAESERIAADVRADSGVQPVVMRMGVPRSYCIDDLHTRDVENLTAVSVGALREKKGHDLLIRAVGGLENLHLVIAGEGPERANLERLVRTVGATDRVRLIGHVDGSSITEILDRANVFCLASRVTQSGDRDGVPNVLIEAMARGVPIVATDVAGIPDLLSDGRGIVVCSNNVEALESAILDCIKNVSAARERASRALQHVKASYTTASNWNRMRECILNILPPEDGSPENPPRALGSCHVAPGASPDGPTA